MKSFLMWFDGKKTIIGLTILSILGESPELFGEYTPIVKIIAGALAGTGLVHKGLKAKKVKG